MDLSTSDKALIDQLYASFGPPRLRFCPLQPTARQEAFLLLDAFEVFYGGAAGGGKTAALLMGALQYVDVPGYHALIVRKSLAELALPGNLIELSHDWLAGGKARWHGDTNQWRFPGRGRSGAGGASITFGYLADDGDLGRYAGSSFSYLAFDELTRFPETHYRRMQRVLRQPTGLNEGAAAPDGARLADVPVRLRAASNPGGEHHEWVKHRFVDPSTRPAEVLYLPSRLADNPHLDQEAYTRRLLELPPAERERLLHGDWEIPDDGELFQRDWFTIIEPHQLPEPATTTRLRYWDLAASEPSSANPDPDYTVGLLLAFEPKSGVYYIVDLIRVRKSAGEIERLVVATAKRDGHNTAIVIEQDAGGAGKALSHRYTTQLLTSYNARSDRVTGPKEIRAQPVAAAAENGTIRIVRNQHTTALLDELTAFPRSRHDDIVDALAGAHKHIARHTRHRLRSYVPRGRLPTTDQIINNHLRQNVYGYTDPTTHLTAQLNAQAHNRRN